jgi:hypothetical protein
VGGGNLPRSHTVYDDVAGTEGGQGGHLLDDEDRQQLRDVVAVAHVGLTFVVEGRKDLACRRFALFETTLVVIVSSLSSVIRNFNVPMPALAMSTSRRGSSALTLSEKAWTEAYELMSRCHTWRVSDEHEVVA